SGDLAGPAERGRSQAAAHAGPTPWLRPVEELVDVTAQEHAVRHLVFAAISEGPNVGGLKRGQRVLGGHGAGTAICGGHGDAEDALAETRLDQDGGAMALSGEDLFQRGLAYLLWPSRPRDALLPDPGAFAAREVVALALDGVLGPAAGRAHPGLAIEEGRLRKHQ